jgi:hypothetical protein
MYDFIPTKFLPLSQVSVLAHLKFYNINCVAIRYTFFFTVSFSLKFFWKSHLSAESVTIYITRFWMFSVQKSDNFKYCSGTLHVVISPLCLVTCDLLMDWQSKRKRYTYTTTKIHALVCVSHPFIILLLILDAQRRA